MDTRTKIVRIETARENARGSRTLVVTGYFDPLLAQHSRRLRELRGGCDTLIVLLSDPPEAILTAQARAELVAALEVVDYVVHSECGARTPACRVDTPVDAWVTPEIKVVHGESSDQADFQWLVKHVHARHQ